MDAVEINAGTWYLRALRCDDRISDVPALSDLGIDSPEEYVREADSGWSGETLFTWAVCVPTTGELVALVGVTPDGTTGRLRGRARPGFDDALAAAIDPVTRFAEGALGLTVVTD